MKEKATNLFWKIFLIVIGVIMVLLALESVINVLGTIFVKIFS